MSVFDLIGPEFLKFYFLLALFAAFGSALLRYWMRGPGDLPTADQHLGPYEAACLGGGPSAVIDTAIATLVHRDALKVVGSGLFEPDGALPEDADEVEREVHEAAGEVASPTSIRRRCMYLGTAIHRKLADKGLMLSDEQANAARVLPILPILLVAGIGVLKTFIGVSRDRPVFFLLGLTVLVSITALALGLKKPLRTRRGDKVLATLRSRNAALRTSGNALPEMLTPLDFATFVGLYGVTMLPMAHYGGLQSSLEEEHRKSRSSWGSSSCGSSGSCGTSASSCSSSSCGSSCSSGCGGCSSAGD